MIELTQSEYPKDLEGILSLQTQNLKINLSQEEIDSQGFVTIVHDLNLLTQMNTAAKHTVAKVGDRVIGYTLVMLPSFKSHIPFLIPTFQKIMTLKFNNQLIKESDYFLMGQVCIDKAFRGQGVFTKLYQHLKDTWSKKYAYIITEIALENKRSLRAHEKVGFQIIDEYFHAEKDWAVVLWDWS